MFENFIILLIFLNSIILAIYDYNDRDNELEWNKRLELIGEVFTILFTIEMVLKILAQGFIIHYNSYLRDVWSWLDFVVVITGLMEMMQISWFKVRALRTLRVLRPLRSIKAFPKMRKLVSSLTGSIDKLFNAVIFMMFIFMLFGILGIQQFQTMYNRCRETEQPLSDGTWPIDEDLEYLCSPDGQGFMECPQSRFCKQPSDAGLGADLDEPNNQELIFYNMIGFDNLGWAMLTIFQMITLEQWTTVMYLLMDSNIWWMAVFFCISLVLIGSFFLLNVILAVLADALNMVEAVQIKQDTDRLTKIKQSLDRAEAQRQWWWQSSRKYAVNDDDNSQKCHESIDFPKQYNDGIPFINVENLDLKKSNPDMNQNSGKEFESNLDQSIDSKINSSQVIDPVFQDQALPKSSDKTEKEKANNNDAQNDAQNDEYPTHAQKNGLFKVCYKVCTHWTFTFLITVLIVGNTVVLAMEKYPEDAESTKIANILNEIFTWAFVVEMVIKLLGIGFKEYARDSFNLFDAFIVILSIIDMIISAIFSGDSPTGALSAFRGVRLLRVFKLARSWTSFRMILAKILVTIKDVSTFSVLLLMFVLIFSLLGMELFGHKIRFYDDIYVAPGDPNYDQSEPPRPNFDDLVMSITSIFAVAIGDDWNYFMAMAYRAEGFIAIIYYPFVFIFTNLVLLNLFLAMLLQKFETKEEDEDDQNEQDQKSDNKYVKYSRRLKKKCKPCIDLFKCCKVNEKEHNDSNFGSEDIAAGDIINQSFDISAELGDDKAKDSFTQKESSDSSMLESDSSLEIEDSDEEEDRIQNKKPQSQDDFSKSENDDEKESIVMDSSSNRMNRKSKTQKVIGNIRMFGALASRDDSIRKFNAPGNQQDTFAKSFEGASINSGSQAVPADKTNSQKNLMKSTTKAGQQNKSQPGLFRAAALDRQKTVTGGRKSFANVANNLTLEIPTEYNPNIVRELYRKKSSMGGGAQELKNLAMISVILQNSDKKMNMTEMKKIELIEKKIEEKKKITVIGRSLFIFSKTNPIRQFTRLVVSHPFYDSVVLFLIGISSILLILDNPNMDDQGQLANILGIFDYVLTTLFTIECLINVILLGLICNGKFSYARDPWNVMDLLIVIFSIMTIILQGQGGADLSILKVFRMLRVLRPLRFLKRNLGLKIQAISLLKSIPDIANLLMIVSLVLMIFGIQAVGLLKGTFYNCDTSNVPEYLHSKIQTKWDCLDLGGDWVNLEDNFDNVFNAMITLFGMMSTEGWLEVMWSAVDSTQIHQVPLQNNNMLFIFFFCSFMIIGSLLFLNLFVGVVINTFNIEKEKLSKNKHLTHLQNEYCEVLIKCFQLRPLIKTVQTGNKCRDFMTRIVQHQAFDIFIFTCICLNTVVLAMSWYGMEQSILDVLEVLNYIFTVIYTFEMAIKLPAMGKSYFRDNWCLFDFIIVISAWIGIILLQLFNIDLGSISTIIRSFRIARVLKLIKTAKNLQQIFQTFVRAIPEMINVGALLMLFLFLFAVLGVSLFAEVKMQDTLNRHTNFLNFGQAILTLLRVSTGEGWVGIMQDAGRTPSIQFECLEKQTYQSKVENGIVGCGSPAAYFYFAAFILIVSLVFLNLFIAIILEGFAASATEQSIRVDDDCLEAFKRAWARYDPLATEIISIDQLENLIMDLIVEELEIMVKTKTQKANFNLSKKRILMYYTKWRCNKLTEEDREGILSNIDTNPGLQRGLHKYMREFIRNLSIPLYDKMKNIQFHDTLNGIISSVYIHIHKQYVKDRNMRIETKIKVGEELEGLEKIKVGSEEFWDMHPYDQEELLQRSENDFQRIINRLENKANQQILKLNFMRFLRKKAGLKFSHRLSSYGSHEGIQQVHDSSHWVGAKIIEYYQLQHIKRAQEKKLQQEELTSRQEDEMPLHQPETSTEQIKKDQQFTDHGFTLKKSIKCDEDSLNLDDSRLVTIQESNEQADDVTPIVMQEHYAQNLDFVVINRPESNQKVEKNFNSSKIFIADGEVPAPPSQTPDKIEKAQAIQKHDSIASLQRELDYSMSNQSEERQKSHDNDDFNDAREEKDDVSALALYQSIAPGQMNKISSQELINLDQSPFKELEQSPFKELDLDQAEIFLKSDLNPAPQQQAPDKNSKVNQNSSEAQPVLGIQKISVSSRDELEDKQKTSIVFQTQDVDSGVEFHGDSFRLGVQRSIEGGFQSVQSVAEQIQTGKFDSRGDNPEQLQSMGRQAFNQTTQQNSKGVVVSRKRKQHIKWGKQTSQEIQNNSPRLHSDLDGVKPHLTPYIEAQKRQPKSITTQTDRAVDKRLKLIHLTNTILEYDANKRFKLPTSNESKQDLSSSNLSKKQGTEEQFCHTLNSSGHLQSIEDSKQKGIKQTKSISLSTQQKNRMESQEQIKNQVKANRQQKPVASEQHSVESHSIIMPKRKQPTPMRLSESYQPIAKQHHVPKIGQLVKRVKGPSEKITEPVLNDQLRTGQRKVQNTETLDVSNTQNSQVRESPEENDIISFSNQLEPRGIMEFRVATQEQKNRDNSIISDYQHNEEDHRIVTKLTAVPLTSNKQRRLNNVRENLRSELNKTPDIIQMNKTHHPSNQKKTKFNLTSTADKFWSSTAPKHQLQTESGDRQLRSSLDPHSGKPQAVQPQLQYFSPRIDSLMARLEREREQMKTGQVSKNGRKMLDSIELEEFERRSSPDFVDNHKRSQSQIKIQEQVYKKTQQISSILHAYQML